MIELTAKTYLEAFKNYPSHAGITGGTIHDFLRESVVTYHGGNCPVYYVEHYHNGNKCIVGGNYATNGKPGLKIFEQLDFN
ncbi:MAG: hypothetical protein RBR14_08755 [Candidatus Cloacimonas acidaminovorans]|nr:hypothetical protein [Candidatus Cloacimonas acidaminovorans]